MIRINWDKFGVAASIACAIHCAVLPLFLTSLPVFGINLIENRLFEFGMIGLAVIIGIVSLSHGFRWHHHKLIPIGIFLSGIALLVVREMVGNHPIWATVGGLSCIALAHYLNYRFCRQANHCHTSDCNH